MSARRATTSANQEPCIFGRNEDLAKVKQFLLSPDVQVFSESGDMDIPVMAILGMGGLGKTTLAQLAYHDDEVNQHFQLKWWVCISENFDIIPMTKAMIKRHAISRSYILFTRRLKGYCTRKIEKLSSHWNLLMAPLHNSSACSKIIITSPNNKVSKIGGGISAYDLPCLEDGDCLKLFKQHAFKGQDPNLYPNLVAIGEKITRNCKGLPLVAKIIGSQLHATGLARKHGRTS
ncbi:hypothetical protein Taro_010979 [Colocasia esculenta]|uniref:NB-ARC domain-containing protein n=1 Tax=Colocasia esculenta TaxID=4460 RepID=A0A843U9C0_COLES|nr:hypothetical protein [Colocasia esculenta]